TNWAIQQTAATSTAVAKASLSGVSCVASGLFCKAVGQYGDKPFIQTWNGQHWSIDSVPMPRPDDGINTILSGVTCVSKYFCQAVGHVAVNVGNDPGGRSIALVETWNGTTWTAHQIF